MIFTLGVVKGVVATRKKPSTTMQIQHSKMLAPVFLRIFLEVPSTGCSVVNRITHFKAHNKILNISALYLGMKWSYLYSGCGITIDSLIPHQRLSKL